MADRALAAVPALTYDCCDHCCLFVDGETCDNAPHPDDPCHHVYCPGAEPVATAARDAVT